MVKLSTTHEIFENKDWIILNQPSQSPVTNVHDACVFPMMSKKVSGEKATAFGSKLLRDVCLNNTVMKVFNDGAQLPAIAREFDGHSQIVSAIRNDFLKKWWNSLWSAM